MSINSFYMIIGVNNQELVFRNVKSRDSILAITFIGISRDCFGIPFLHFSFFESSCNECLSNCIWL